MLDGYDSSSFPTSGQHWLSRRPADRSSAEKEGAPRASLAVPGGLRSVRVVPTQGHRLPLAASRALSFPDYASPSVLEQLSGKRLLLLSSAGCRVGSLLGKLKWVLLPLRAVRTY
jgi:hypothetical protein